MRNVLAIAVILSFGCLILSCNSNPPSDSTRGSAGESKTTKEPEFNQPTTEIPKTEQKKESTAPKAEKTKATVKGEPKSQTGTPTFEQYRVKVSSAKPKPINFSKNKEARMFRTRLNDALKEGVNFAGHFIYTGWGCGTGCAIGAVIDTHTGIVYLPDELGGMGFGVGGVPVADKPLQYRKDSKLFILSGSAANGRGEGVTYLVWEGTKFRQVKFVRSGDKMDN